MALMDAQQWRILGNWEPKMFLQRRGDCAFYNVDRLWEEIHSDAAIGTMKELGINLSHIHFHKGYGLEFERESIDEAKAWAEKLHIHGIRVGVYIGCTVFPETFVHLDSDRIIAKDGGQPWSREQYFRRFWCYNSPQSQAYFEQVIRVAIEYVDADVLHFDAAFNFVNGAACHCDACLKGFHCFLDEEIPEIIKATGYARGEQLMPPPLMSSSHLAHLTKVKEPGAIAWALYQAKSGYRALDHFARFARSLRPEIGILFNGSTLCGIHPFCCNDLEMSKLRIVQVTCVEDSLENPPGMTSDGMPISRFRAYKAAARSKTRVCYYTTEHGGDAPLMLAEAAVFSYASLGFVEMAMQVNRRVDTPEARAMLDYLVAHEALFLRREHWHHVAVLRHQTSQILNPFPSGLSPYIIEQILFEHHIPFAIVCELDLDQRLLKREFDLLILPDCACLENREIIEIEAFVAAGGRLLSIGDTASATPLNQHRDQHGLARIFKGELRSSRTQVCYEETANTRSLSASHADAASTLYSSYGRGRAVHIPGIAFDLPDKTHLNRFAGFDWYYHPYWRAPHNAAQILESVTELIGERWRVRLDLPRHVGAEFYRAANEYRIQFVNYNSMLVVRDGRLTLRADLLASKPSLIFWDAPGMHYSLTCPTCIDDTYRIDLPPIDRLGVLRIQPSL